MGESLEDGRLIVHKLFIVAYVYIDQPKHMTDLPFN